MAVGRILPRVIRRYAPIFAALAMLAPGCKSQRAEDHFNLRGQARQSWAAAAEQVCGFREPITGAGSILKEVNERHIAGIGQIYAGERPTPVDADHRVWRGLDRESAEIFLPGSTREEICQAPAERPAEIPLEPIPTAQPDAGTPDSAVPDAGIQDAAPTKTYRPRPPRPPQTGTPTPTPTPTPPTPTPPTTSQPVVPL